MNFPDANSPVPPHLYYIICTSCGGDGWGPMLRREIWEKIEPKGTFFSPRGRVETFLCQQCMETRLGRKLTSDDLRDCPMNFKHPRYKPHGRVD